MNHTFKIVRFAWIIFVWIALSLNTSVAQYKKAAPLQASVKLGLNAYSFNDLLTGNGQKDNTPVLTLPLLLDWCASHNIAAIDLTGYYFPGYPEVPSDEYIYEIKRKAFRLGIDISGTGIRNNFASPDPAARAADVERAKKWIIVASKLGAPVIRLFAGEIPKGYEDKWDEVAGWMIDCFKECAAFGEQHGVIIGIQNHGDMLQTADQCIKVMNAVNSKWAGIILDIGSFRVADPYVDIEAVIPYSVNWQVKERVYGPQGPVKTDFKRLGQIIKRSGYRGYLPVETLQVKGVPYNPFEGVPIMLQELDAALKN